MQKTNKIRLIFLIVLLGIGFNWPLAVNSAEKGSEIEKIKKMKEKDLTIQAKQVFEKKYAGENWEQYKFPKFVYTNEAVLIGYKIAVKESLLLAKFKCYCFCEEMGHKNLAYCFLEEGRPEGKFDDHAATCNICYTQAMRAFLWRELGMKDEEISKAMAETYEK
ncbi:MAG: PCYCGC motif-containing (lipo)protein [Thermodesulfobacteriota bacterium]